MLRSRIQFDRTTFGRAGSRSLEMTLTGASGIQLRSFLKIIGRE